MNRNPCDLEQQQDSDDEELARDLGGRLHVSTEDNQDGMYVINAHENVALVRFPIEDFNPALLEFRTYIKHHIPNQLFRDDYGNHVRMDDMEPGHLAGLQWKLWGAMPRGQAAISPPLVNLCWADVAIGIAVAEISKTLATSPHVFIIHARKATKCENPLCQSLHATSKTAGIQLQTISLEPLLDVATLCPASDLKLFNGRIYVFRRDDSKYVNMGFNINTIVQKSRKMYCVECLQFLWDQRVKAWGAIDQFSYEEKTKVYHRKVMAKTQEEQGRMSREPSKHANLASKKKPFCQEDVSARITNIKNRSIDKAIQETLQLEGANDFKPPHFKLPLRVHIPLHQQNGERDVSEPQTKEGISLTRNPVSSSTYNNDTKEAATTASADSQIPSKWTAINDGTTTEVTTSSAHLYNSREEREYLLDPMDPTISGKPFKETFDSSTAEELYTGYRRTVPTGPPVPFQYKRLAIPVPPTAPLDFPTSKGSRADRLEKKESGLTRSLILSSAERCILGKTIAELSPRDERKRKREESTFFVPDTEHEPTSAESNDSLLDRHSKKQLKFWKPTWKLASKPNVPSFQHVATSKEDKSRFPKHLVPVALYCSCRKPKGGQAMIRCANAVCPISWFHYSCLTKGGKISSLYGRWLCEVCKTANHFAADSEPLRLSKIFKSPFSDREMANGLNGPAPLGFEAVKDPYGLGSMRPVGVPDAANIIGEDDSILDWVGDDEADYEDEEIEGFEVYDEEMERETDVMKWG